VNKDKKPQLRDVPIGAKSPRFSTDPTSYYELQPAWRLNKLEMCEPFGWHSVDKETIERIRSRLVAFESMTWREILVEGRKRNHSIKTEDLCRAAQKRLEEIGLDDIDRLHSLGLTGAGRIWGLFSHGVMSLLWWDPDHQICPSPLKHT
jgi:hypothetical protein